MRELWQRLDKTVVASVALHLVVFGWGLFSFQSKAFEVTPGESLPVDVISADQLAKVMAGQKSGKKDNPKPLVEKVAEAKPFEDTVGKITEKPPVITETAPKPAPVVEKPAEKKPDPKPEPPKPVAEAKPEPPKETPKPVEKKPEPPKVDPIAEALKKEQAKETPKEPPKEAAKDKPKPVQKAAATPPPPQERIKERHFDQSQIASLLDKRDPSRAAATGASLNSNAALGLARGTAADNSATWGALFRSQVERCWKKPFGGIEQRNFVAVFTIRLKADGTLEQTPAPVGSNANPAFRAYQESAQRGIIACQPYKLPAAFFEEWKFFEGAFDEKET